GWTITPAGVQTRFNQTRGTDPIFRTNDGSNSPNADVSTFKARRAAYSMLLTKGLIRVGIGIPNDAEFELIAVDDPYGFASATELSLFRRPLPSTNLKFLSTVMWDGRETFPGETIHFDLSHQSNSATTGHAQGADLTEQQRESIVAFETALFTAQIYDERAGRLTARGPKVGRYISPTRSFTLGLMISLATARRVRRLIRLFSVSTMPGRVYLTKARTGRARPWPAGRNYSTRN